MRAVLALIVLLAFAVAPVRALDGRRLRLHGGRLVDERRREVTLRGVNARVEGVFDVTFDDGRLPLEPIPVFDDGDAATMARFGLNLLRLPISWSALEPARGRFDAAYLDRIAAVVALCRAHGILVLLDFHQDAFSKEIGEDGAPRWVLDLLLGPNDYPYLGGPLTDLGARRTAPATLAAFRQFFLDAGGVQEDLAAAAVVLARRFAHERAVLGYEILNEPLAFLAPNGDAALRAFHERVARAIRRVDRRHLIAFEPDVIRNATNRAPVPAAPFPVRGTLYAPHIYTDVFDGHDLRERRPGGARALDGARSGGGRGLGRTAPGRRVRHRPERAERERVDHGRARPPGSPARALDVLAVGGDQPGPLGPLRRGELGAGRGADRPDDGTLTGLRARRAGARPRAYVRRQRQHAPPALHRARLGAARAVRPRPPLSGWVHAPLRREGRGGAARPGRHAPLRAGTGRAPGRARPGLLTAMVWTSAPVLQART